MSNETKIFNVHGTFPERNRINSAIVDSGPLYRPIHCGSENMDQLLNGIAQNYKDRFS